MLLNSINIPRDLKKLKPGQLQELCAELREFVQEKTSTKEGHIRSSLGVTELTVALHYVLDTPQDILIWDVGHQAYIHKILTGRKDQFHTNRLMGGLSGFTRSSESEYDPFGAGHSSTSVSAAVGFAMADKVKGAQRTVAAVIGDGALTGGMSFEALNYLGEQQLNLLIVLNDNQSSIDKNVGALAKYGSYESYCKALNINYLGECEGHKVEALVDKLRTAQTLSGPRFLRVKTDKGRGHKPVPKKSSSPQAFYELFGQTMLQLAEKDDRIVAITPAMLSGSGLTRFGEIFPNRCYDVGIAEQHAVTMAAGMAANGLKPVVHLYSTFAQRAYDQIIHDVALQNLPVVFCLDRAGLVGQDGGTHHGVFDPGFLSTLPNVTIAAPMDGISLQNLLSQALEDNTPWFIRYPKDSYAQWNNIPLPEKGKARLLKQGTEAAVLSFGAIGVEVKEAVEGTDMAHYDFTYLKPIDRETLRQIARSFNSVYTVEENSARGGLGDAVRAAYAEMGTSVKVKSKTLPDHFIEHGTRAELLQLAGLNAKGLKEFLFGS